MDNKTAKIERKKGERGRKNQMKDNRIIIINYILHSFFCLFWFLVVSAFCFRLETNVKNLEKKKHFVGRKKSMRMMIIELMMDALDSFDNNSFHSFIHIIE